MGSKSRNNTFSVRLGRPPRRWCLALAAMVVASYVGAGVVGAQVPSRDLTSYVLLGLDKIQMKEFSFTNVGNIGVNAAGGTMQWGRKSFFFNGTQVVADIVNRAGDHSSLSCLFANDVNSPLANITIRTRPGPANLGSDAADQRTAARPELQPGDHRGDGREGRLPAPGTRVVTASCGS